MYLSENSHMILVNGLNYKENISENIRKYFRNNRLKKICVYKRKYFLENYLSFAISLAKDM